MNEIEKLIKKIEKNEKVEVYETKHFDNLYGKKLHFVPNANYSYFVLKKGIDDELIEYFEKDRINEKKIFRSSDFVIIKLSNKTIEKIKSNWVIIGGYLCKTFYFKNNDEMFKFLNYVKKIIDEMKHNPELDVRENYVLVKLKTYVIDGISDKDRKFAKKIEEWKK